MKVSRWFSLALVAMFAVTAVSAGEQKSAQSPPMDKKAMMEAYAKLSTPGEGHKMLEPIIGSWNVVVKSYMQPGAPAMESSGTSEHQWVLGGRYVEQRFDGSFMDQKFHGIGYSGYDNTKKEYFSTWMDSMSTGVMVATGKGKEKERGIELTGTMEDPFQGTMQITEKLKIVDNDHHTFEMWTPGPDGKPFMMMEIAYKRKK
ncbi:MAG TPA: DUF1579 domain-containing protein [Thermoanaerobaculia bacterium]|nr:DUF1579 domain-containing protein [Thermoanaerobaculia bacterium]